MKFGRRGFFAVAAMGATLLAGCSEPKPMSTADAQPFTARIAAPRAISGPSPFAPSGCGHIETTLVPYDFGVEFDLSVAVNPLDPQQVVAAWIQDNALGVLAARSHDGGLTWQQAAAVPGFSLCAGGQDGRVFHSRLSFGPDGRLYLAVQASGGFDPDPRAISEARVAVAVSGDGGASWGAVSYMDSSTDPIPQFDGLTSEPDLPGAALVVWHDLEPTNPVVGTTYLSRTTDGGATWARLTAHRGEGDTIPWNRAVALPDGTLLLMSANATVRGFTGAPAPANAVTVRRSEDKGATWSEPVTIADGVQFSWGSAAVGGDGSVYLGWPAFTGDGARRFFVTRSTDSGKTWDEPVAAANYAGRDGAAPGLAVAGNGAVAFNYTDSRNATAEQPALRDAWLAYSTDGGRTWQELHLAGPFELGDDASFFHETVGLPTGFAAVFPAGAPLALDGRTDVFFARVEVE